MDKNLFVGGEYLLDAVINKEPAIWESVVNEFFML